MVAEEQQTYAEKAIVLRWFARVGWIVLTGSVLLIAYLMGVI